MALWTPSDCSTTWWSSLSLLFLKDIVSWVLGPLHFIEVISFVMLCFYKPRWPFPPYESKSRSDWNYSSICVIFVFLPHNNLSLMLGFLKCAFYEDRYPCLKLDPISSLPHCIYHLLPSSSNACSGSHHFHPHLHARASCHMHRLCLSSHH